MSSFQIKRFTSAFIANWDNKFDYAGEAHIMCEVVFVESGNVTVTEENRVYDLEEGQFILHGPREFHRIKSAKNSNPTVRVVSFGVDGRLPEALTDGVFTLGLKEREDFMLAFESIKKICKKDDAEELDVEEAICRMKAFLIRISRAKADKGTSLMRSAKTYHKIISFMEKNVLLNYSIDEIAEQNFISKTYLKYLFKKYANISPKQYDIYIKIKTANELIKQGLSICDIAASMNFSSPNYFSGFYKKHTGMTPSEYKGAVKR